MVASPTPKVSSKIQDLQKTDFELKVTNKAIKIEELIDLIDENNTGLLEDIDECREEYFKLENKKNSLIETQYPCEQTIKILEDL